MQFSVVIPLFNKAPHVAASVRSALRQTHPPLEVIVVDDGSTDGSLDVVHAISDSRLKVLTRSPPGSGGYAARNLGVHEARGEWVAFLDADDLWHDNHLESLAAAAAAAGPAAGCVFSRFERVRDDRRWQDPIAPELAQPGAVHDMEAVLRGWISTGLCPIWTGAVAIRRSVLIEAGAFPVGTVSRGGDKDTWLRVIAITRTAHAPQTTVEFHQDSVNRVTFATTTTRVPALTATSERLQRHARGERRRLLRLIANLEIKLYARQAAGQGRRIGTEFPKAIYLPDGMAALASVVVYMGLSYLVRFVRAGAVRRMA